MKMLIAIGLAGLLLHAPAAGAAQPSPKCKALSVVTSVEAIPSAGPGADAITITTTTTKQRCRGRIVTTVERDWR